MLFLTTPLPLATTTAELRSGQRDLLVFIREVCDRIDALEPYIQALLPELERGIRLLAEATSLQQRFPDTARRPPLYGVLLGIKAGRGTLTYHGFPYVLSLTWSPDSRLIAATSEGNTVQVLQAI